MISITSGVVYSKLLIVLIDRLLAAISQYMNNNSMNLGYVYGNIDLVGIPCFIIDIIVNSLIRPNVGVSRSSLSSNIWL